MRIRDAILAGNEEVIRQHLDGRLNPNMMDYINDDVGSKASLLYFAVKSTRLNIVKLLIEYGALVRLTDRDDPLDWNDDDALRLAVTNGHAEIVDYLLECGADPNGLFETSHFISSITFLAKAAADGNIQLVESLIKHGANVPVTLTLAYDNMYVSGYKKTFFAIERLNESNPKVINELKQKANEFKTTYERILKTCMDYAIGCDFNCSPFFKGLNVSDINFFGVSIAGRPVTQEILKNEGALNAEYAIVTMSDLMALDNKNRKNSLLNRFETVRTKQGELYEDNTVVNLVPLNCAAEIGDLAAVKARIYAGIDPNIEGKAALISAAENNQVEIVKVLLNAHGEHSKNKAMRLIEQAQKFVSNTPNLRLRCVQVTDGQLRDIATPLANDHYRIIIPGNQTISQTNKLIKQFDQQTLNKIQSTVEQIETKNENIIILLKDDGSWKETVYGKDVDHQELKKDITKLIKSANIQPYVFVTNNHNINLIQEMIESQYQEIDMQKSVRVEAARVAKEHAHTAILELLRSQLDINAQDENGNTTLHDAVQKCDISRVSELLQQGADVNIINKDKNNPLAQLIEKQTHYTPKGQKRNADQVLAIVKILLKQNAKVDIDILKNALKLEHASQTLELLLSNFNPSEIIHTSEPWYVELMFMAARREDAIAVLSILKNFGADFNRPQDNQILLNYMFHCLPSIYKVTDEDRGVYFANKLSLLNYLLENGANPRTVDSDDNVTPLYTLIHDTNLTDLPGNTYQLWLDALLQKGVSVNAVTNGQQYTPLHAAACTKDINAVSYLLEHGADINAKTAGGETALHLAAKICCAPVIVSLLQAGADRTVTTNDNQSVLDLLKSTYKKRKKNLEDELKELESPQSSTIRFFSDLLPQKRKEILVKMRQLDIDYQNSRTVLSVPRLHESIHPH